MFTEFYSLKADDPKRMDEINQRVAKIRKQIGEASTLTTEAERAGNFLYITIRYWATEPVSS